MDRALIDTDILSYYFRGDPVVVKNFQKYLKNFETIEISVVTFYEIMSGLLAKNAFKQLAVFEDFVSGRSVVIGRPESTALRDALQYDRRHRSFGEERAG